MHTASLESFCRTGRLGPIACAVTRCQVVEALGPPSDWINGTRVERSGIWKYGDVELHFDPQDDRVWLIHFDWFDRPHCGPSLLLDPWVIHRGLLLADLLSALDDGHIAFDQRSDPVNPDCVKVVTDVGVSLLVGVDGADGVGLQVFGISEI